MKVLQSCKVFCDGISISCNGHPFSRKEPDFVCVCVCRNKLYEVVLAKIAEIMKQI